VSANGEYIAADTEGGNVYFLDKWGNLLWQNKVANDAYETGVSYDGGYSVYGSLDWQNLTYSAYLFNKNGSLLWTRKALDACGVAISDDGKNIAVGADNEFVFLYTRDGAQVWKYRAGGAVTGVTMSSDANFIKSSLSSESSLSSLPISQAISYLDESRKEADYTSVFSEILQAIDSCIDLGLVLNGRILIQAITSEFNSNRDEKFKVSPATVGGYLKTLGFEKQHMSEGNAIIYNEGLYNQAGARLTWRWIRTWIIRICKNQWVEHMFQHKCKICRSSKAEEIEFARFYLGWCYKTIVDTFGDDIDSLSGYNLSTHFNRHTSSEIKRFRRGIKQQAELEKD